MSGLLRGFRPDYQGRPEVDHEGHPTELAERHHRQKNQQGLPCELTRMVKQQIGKARGKESLVKALQSMK